MSEYLEHPIDAGDLGVPFRLQWRLTNGEWLFIGAELGRCDLSLGDTIHALWGVVNSSANLPYDAREAAVKRWISHRLDDALEARGSDADTAACERAHLYMEAAE